MQPKIPTHWLMFTVSIVGIVFSAIIIFSTPTTSSQTPQNLINSASVASIPNVISTEQASVGIPIRLKIPAINIDAAIEYVGVTSEGTLDVPKNPIDVAWFNLGPRPGGNGSAIIVGHYGGKKASVFDNLYKLRKGDKLYVEDEFGTTTVFVVRETRRYDPSADASYVFKSSDGKSHLNLITCEGDWDKVSKDYSKRLVVFTDIEVQ